MSIKDMVIRLRIEEDNRRFEKKMTHNPNEAKANFVEHCQSFKFNKGNNKGKDTKLAPKGGVSKMKKFIGKCFNSKQTDHPLVIKKKKKKKKMLQLWEARPQIFGLQTAKEEQT